jgi:hypothetical protein
MRENRTHQHKEICYLASCWGPLQTKINNFNPATPGNDSYCNGFFKLKIKKCANQSKSPDFEGKFF